MKIPMLENRHCCVYSDRRSRYGLGTEYVYFVFLTSQPVHIVATSTFCDVILAIIKNLVANATTSQLVDLNHLEILTLIMSMLILEHAQDPSKSDFRALVVPHRCCQESSLCSCLIAYTHQGSLSLHNYYQS